MNMDMDINRSKTAIVSLFMITICFLLLLLSTNADSRGISVISDLSHQSGKLGAYRALIIGINDYKDPKIPDLETAVNDASAMAKLLRKRYGFQVKLLLNRKATREGIYRALRELALSTKADDSILIYYAGHGDLDRTYDDGWWIPVDAKGGNPVTYLDNGQVQKAMRSMKARHVLLISDSCYSGTLFGQARAMPPIIDDKYYLNLYNEKSRWGMTSGNKTPVSDRGSGGHSVFAYQLLKELKKNTKPFFSTQEIYTRIAPIVSNNSEQIPLCRPIRNTGDQGGEFVFVISSGGTASVQKSISVKAEPKQLPPEVGVSFDDILKAEEIQRQAKERWMGWQQAREKEYRSIKEIDESKNLTPEQKTVAWQRFLAAVSQDNPYSRQDNEIRSYSRSRLNHWQSVKPSMTNPDIPAGLIGSDKVDASLVAKRKRLKQEHSDLEKIKAENLKRDNAQKMQLAYVPKAPSIERLDSRYKLAILPWKLVNNRTYTDTETSIRAGTEYALKKTIKADQIFIPEFSYYDLIKVKTKKISDEILTKKVSDNLWIRKNIFSSVIPNVDLICNIGKKLHVDAILTYYIYVGSYSEPINVDAFLINVNSKKIYHEKSSGINAPYNVILEFQMVTNKVYAAYEKDAS